MPFASPRKRSKLTPTSAQRTATSFAQPIATTSRFWNLTAPAARQGPTSVHPGPVRRAEASLLGSGWSSSNGGRIRPACARRPPAAGWGRCTAGDPDSFGCDAVSRPTGMSSGVQMRFSYVQAHKWPEAPDLAQYRAVLGCRTLTQRGTPVHFGAVATADGWDGADPLHLHQIGVAAVENGVCGEAPPTLGDNHQREDNSSRVRSRSLV
jgi:hypothetical protein